MIKLEGKIVRSLDETGFRQLGEFNENVFHAGFTDYLEQRFDRERIANESFVS